MKLSCLLKLSLLLSLGTGIFAADEIKETPGPSNSQWSDATGNLSSIDAGYGWVAMMAAVPGTNEIIAGISKAWLWSTTDSGKTWKPMTGALPASSAPGHIVFDPKDPRTFWVSAIHGPGLFKTTDGGKTFEQLKPVNPWDVDGIGIDFADPERKTMIIGHHERPRSVEKSTDGGKTWTKIGDRLPENTNFSSEPFILKPNVFLSNAAGWKKDVIRGIFRSEDGGETWTKVADNGPRGPPTVVADGTIYWGKDRILRSADDGKTWTVVEPIMKKVIEIVPERLVGMGQNQIHLSTDNGKTWQSTDVQLPKGAKSLIYSKVEEAFYTWCSADAEGINKEKNRIYRLAMPGKWKASDGK